MLTVTEDRNAGRRPALLGFGITLTFLIFIALNPRAINAQADEVCREFGETPTRESTRGRLVPFVYGKITLKGLNADARPPRVIVTYSDSQQPALKQPINRSGSYCFRKPGSAGTLVIEVDGVEAARRSVSDIGAVRQREDFEILISQVGQTAPPAVVSTKFMRPQNDATVELYKKTSEAEREKQYLKAIGYVKQIVAIDPEDFVAWAKLGALYVDAKSAREADAAFRQALSLRPDYTPALLNLGIMRAVDQKYPEAIELFKRAVVAEPEAARGYRLLGEAFLQNKQGSLGLAALDEAIRIDPLGMAECHLLKAHLYDLVGAGPLAAHEYKAFLAKVPDHPERKRFEKYIKDNPEK